MKKRFTCVCNLFMYLANGTTTLLNQDQGVQMQRSIRCFPAILHLRAQYCRAVKKFLSSDPAPYSTMLYVQMTRPNFYN